MQPDKYAKRGVSSKKEDVHKAIAKLDKGLFPTAFCKILPDFAGNDPGYCNVMHADTAGTKTSLAYIYWRETGDLSVWAGIAQDAIVMNLDDMGCVGITDDIVISSTIGRNKHLIPAEVIAAVIDGTMHFIERMKKHGIGIHHAGGETADVGDIVRTIDVGITAFGRIRRSELIINQIRPGNVIVGLASYGRSVYEDLYNGGMGSNGLTSARHDVFDNIYAEKYPESYNRAIDKEVVYSGSRKLTETWNDLPLDIGKLILSPTRTYLPVIHSVLKNHRAKIDGIIHCTGGGQTKVMHFIDRIHVVKDNLLPLPPLFKLIAAESNTPAEEMYRVFNMGHRLEFYTDEMTANEIISISKDYQIDADIIGHVEESKQKQVTITSELGEFIYTDSN
jgi:phosphoribosylformylglycinamidine cyclo-ligase